MAHSQSESDDDDYAAKFDFEVGAGAPLGSLMCFGAVPKRGAATKALEAALEPLHRLVYGRAGRAGERRDALEAFQGFPLEMRADVLDRMKRLTKAKLTEVVKALRIPVRISDPLNQVADGVTAFLMAPKESSEAKSVTPVARKRPRSSSGAKSVEVRPDAQAKSTMIETTGTTRCPSDDAIRVQVYRRVLTMTPQQRCTLGVKALRSELESFFKLEEGDLRQRKEVIAETASDCVKALMEAEARAAAHEGTAVADTGPQTVTCSVSSDGPVLLPM